ncbi:MAG: hypothetical protein OHK0015_20400 [Chloroflexi bacterium OHK40]
MALPGVRSVHCMHTRERLAKWFHMETIGIHVALVAAQIGNLLLLALWVGLALVALRHLRGAPVHGAARLGWAALIVFVPLLGATAFLIAGPRQPDGKPR